MKKIAFVTCRKLPDLTPDDRLALEPLERIGFKAEPLVWDSWIPRTHEYEGIVVRSCWDYHLNPLEFLKWIGQIGAQNIPLWNPAHVIRWNLDKTYLRDLSEKGVSIPPTVWLAKGSRTSLGAILNKHGWEKAVIKPTVSATAHQTWITSAAQAHLHQARFEEMLQQCDFMVQRFMDEIQTQGEWSFIFFHKEFSHAVLKRALEGDFRVQEEFGGTAHPAIPPASLVEQAQRIVRSIDQPLLYARVDGIELGGRLLLMELELIEPALFLHQDPQAPLRFCRAIDLYLTAPK